MPMIFSDVDLAVMLQVKEVFNPKALLNPDKVFPTRGSCTEVGPGVTRTDEAARRVDRYIAGNGADG
jgi:glycolate oxidase